jgi:hypothetical protein
MIGIVGGGLSAAKVVEGYRDAGGTDAITIWSQDPHGPITGHRSRSDCSAVRRSRPTRSSIPRGGTGNMASTFASGSTSVRSTSSTRTRS